MKRILLLVEGFTEERFVNEILQPYLDDKCLLVPVLIKTRRDDTGHAYKGGYVTYAQFKKQIQNLLQDSSAALVTMMMDYQALPSDFPGKETAQTLTSVKQSAKHIEQRVSEDIPDARFLPYFSCPQIEALLFADMTTLRAQLRAICPKLNINRLRKPPTDPEEMDMQHPPAQLLFEVCPDFVKLEHTISIAKAIGLEAILKRCTHFRQWVEKLSLVCAAGE